jgi:hypothetical protein
MIRAATTLTLTGFDTEIEVRGYPFFGRLVQPVEDRKNNGYPEQAPGIGPPARTYPSTPFNALGVNVQRSSSSTATQPRRKPTPLIGRFAGRLP